MSKRKVRQICQGKCPKCGHIHACHSGKKIWKRVRVRDIEDGRPHIFTRITCATCGEWLGDEPIKKGGR